MENQATNATQGNGMADTMLVNQGQTGIMGLKPPEKIKSLNKEEFTKWKQRFEIYRKATGAHSKPGDVQVALLLHCMGEQCIYVYNTFNLNAQEENDYELVMKKFVDYFVPKKNESINSHLFFTRNQGENETFDVYLTELRKLSSECEFGNLKDRLIRDRIVAGISDTRLKDRLLRETDLTLDKTINICKAAELASERVKQIENRQEVHAVKKKEFRQTQSYSNRKEGEVRSEGAVPRHKKTERGSNDSWDRAGSSRGMEGRHGTNIENGKNVANVGIGTASANVRRARRDARTVDVGATFRRSV